MLKSLAVGTKRSGWQAVVRQHGPLALATVGAGYPIARILLPGAVSVAMFVPLLLLLLWFAWRATQPRSLLQSPLALPLLASAAVLAVSSLAGFADRVTILGGLVHWAEAAVLLFLTISLLAAGWHPRIFTRAVLLVSSLVLLVCAWNLVAWWLQWALLWQPGDPWLPAGIRVTIADNHPNQTAMLINIGLPLAIAALWEARAGWQRWLWAGWLLLAALVLFYTSSRGSWLAAAAITGTMLLPLLWSARQMRRWQRFAGTLALAGCCWALFATLLLVNLQEVQAQRGVRPASLSRPPTTAAGEPGPPAEPAQQAVAQTARNLTNPSGRTTFWRRAVQFFAERPLLGMGPEGYAARYAAVEPNSRVFLAVHAHSIYLTLLSELGLAGVGAILWLIVAALRVWWRGWQRAAPLLLASKQPTTDDRNTRLLLLSGGAAAVGLAVHGLVEVPLIFVTGLVIAVLAAVLMVGDSWRLVPQPPGRGRFWSFQFGRWPLVVHPLHLALVAAALLAWGSGGLVLLQRNAQEALQNQARAALRQGQYAQAIERYNQSIARYPWDTSAYSERATALAWLALDNPERLPLALAAQDEAAQHDPRNLSVPINRSVLLMDMGEPARAESELQNFLSTDTSRWYLPDMLLARLHEQAGRQEEARASWQQAVQREPASAESAACLSSALCRALPLPRSEYASLVVARQLLPAPDAADVQEIEQLASYWDSVDLWAVAALAAERADDPQSAQRFRATAVELSANVARKPTMQLAIVLLRDAVARGDRTTARRLLQEWLAQPDRVLVPQVRRLMATTTELQLAQTLVETATYLDEPLLLEEARHYLQFVQSSLP